MPENGEAEAQGAPGVPESEQAKDALAEEAVLTAAVAFAGHVVTAAQEAADKAGDSIAAPLREAIRRQYLLETATLCLRRLEESYARAADDPEQAGAAGLLRDGATRAASAMEMVEALGDLGLDVLGSLV